MSAYLSAYKLQLATLAVLVLLGGGAYGAFWYGQDIQRRAQIPAELAPERLLYAQEQGWGLGPGGNESGLLVYALPQHLATRLQQGGAAALPSRLNWVPTPLRGDSRWQEPSSAGETLRSDTPADLQAYLHHQGLGVFPDPTWVRAINQALAQPGSYLTYGRIGVVIVMPAQGWVIYAYSA
ncbi:MAG: hypothetical protein ACO1RX_23725 [Candidatus Sericytochromatia bacterium]